MLRRLHKEVDAWHSPHSESLGIDRIASRTTNREPVVTLDVIGAMVQLLSAVRVHGLAALVDLNSDS